MFSDSGGRIGLLLRWSVTLLLLERDVVIACRWACALAAAVLDENLPYMVVVSILGVA